MRRMLARLRKVTAALIIAVLVVVPVADAFACSFELDVNHAASSAVEVDTPTSPLDKAGKDGLPDEAYDVCAHNHCHHPSANIFFVSNVGYDVVAIVPSAFQAPTPASQVNKGLLRPPRS